MAKEGFILLHRKIKDSWLWSDPVLLQRWVDILFSANYEASKVIIKRQVFICERGQCLYSLSTWADRWGVTKKTVLKFFELLQKDEKIETQSETVTTRLTVCNYDSYQTIVNGIGNANRTDKETQGKRELPPSKEELKKNKETNTKVFVGTPQQIASFESFQLWMQEHTPEVCKMTSPITLKQLLILRGIEPDSRGNKVPISKDEVMDILEKIENNKVYLKKYKSPYACIKAWVKENRKNSK